MKAATEKARNQKGNASSQTAQMTPDAWEALQNAPFHRRDFFKGLGALVIGFSVAGTQQEAAAQSAGVPGPPYAAIPVNQTDSWIAIAEDETIHAYSGKCDFGQGFRTVQTQLIAEELGVPINRIHLMICDTAYTPDQGVSSGSQGSPTQFGPSALRQALATAREALFKMASEQLKVPVSDLSAVNGLVSVSSDPSRGMTYGKLVAGKKFNLTVSSTAKYKDPATYTVLGKSVPRFDVPPKVTGEFEYVQSVRLPGMLHGKVVRPPSPGAKVVSVDESSVRGMPGNVRVVVKNDFVGVVADRDWFALKAAEALKVTWSKGDTLPAFDGIYDFMKKQPTRKAYIVNSGDVDGQLKGAKRTFAATYLHPFQMHGSMGTSCAVADVTGTGTTGVATIYSATQGVYPLRDSVANVLGIPRTNIRVIHKEGSGCYGINGADTVSYDAALLSQAVGKPVRVQFTRKDENVAGENYGPAYVINLKAGVDEKGQIQAWDYEGWTFSKGGRPNANNPGNIPTGALVGMATPAVVANTTPTMPAAFSNNSNAAPAYGTGTVAGNSGSTGTINHERVLVHTIQSPFFTGPLRSPNRLQNSFANEAFMDEIASGLGEDPVQYRLRHLRDERMIDALKEVAKAANWQTRPSPKRGNARTGKVTGRGVSVLLYEGDNGYSGLVAEVEVDQDTGKVVVTRFVISQDSGPVSNPDGLKNQMEGGTLQGMSRALREEVKWDDLAVLGVDWRRYPVFQFGEFVPEMVSVPINRLDVRQDGAGEGAITIVAAVLSNAIFDATGARVRQVPFTPDRVLEALKTRAAGLPLAVIKPVRYDGISKEVLLDGSDSADPMRGTLSFQWRAVGRPAAIYGTNQSKATAQFGSGPGEYVFELKVTNAAGDSDVATVTVNYTGR